MPVFQNGFSRKVRIFWSRGQQKEGSSRHRQESRTAQGMGTHYPLRLPETAHKARTAAGLGTSMAGADGRTAGRVQEYRSDSRRYSGWQGARVIESGGRLRCSKLPMRQMGNVCPCLHTSVFSKLPMRQMGDGEKNFCKNRTNANVLWYNRFRQNNKARSTSCTSNTSRCPHTM